MIEVEEVEVVFVMLVVVELDVLELVVRFVGCVIIVGSGLLDDV